MPQGNLNAKIDATLEALAEDYAKDVSLKILDEVLSSPTDQADIEELVAELVKRAFVHGALTCVRDAREHKIPWLRVVQ
jgi:hypothetical protein